MQFNFDILANTVPISVTERKNSLNHVSMRLPVIAWFTACSVLVTFSTEKALVNIYEIILYFAVLNHARI
jgi:predicted ABC-type exoprotein transport system permease subunit